MLLRLIQLVCLLCCTAATEVRPTPGTQDIQGLFVASDVVCNCSIKSTRPLSPHSAPTPIGEPARPRFIADVVVIDAYKRPESMHSTLTVEYDDDQLRIGEHGILFLRSSSSSTFTLADPSGGVTPFALLPVSSSAPDVQKLVSVLLQVARGSSHEDQLNALMLLQGLPLGPGAIPELTLLANSSDPETAFATFAVLLKTQSVEQLERFCLYLRSHRGNLEPLSVLSIGSELGQLRDNRALPFLNELSGSNILSVRIGSMQALRAIKNPKAAPAIIKRLDDPDGYIRYLAVMSLAETFEKYGDYAPNMELFDHNQAFYLGLWKSWWATDGQVYATGQN